MSPFCLRSKLLRRLDPGGEEKTRITRSVDFLEEIFGCYFHGSEETCQSYIHLEDKTDITFTCTAFTVKSTHS